MAVIAQSPKSFAFIFPKASGHVNPSLGLARTLVELGHKVHYLCREPMREAIEDTGAFLHEDTAYCTELFTEGREPDTLGAMASLKKEFGLEKEGFLAGLAKLGNVSLELQIPGVLRFLEQVDASAVMYDPLFSREAAVAARVLGLPCIGLLTTAGPGSIEQVMHDFLQKEGIDAESLHNAVLDFEPNVQAAGRINEKYNLDLEAIPNFGLKPLGEIREMALCDVTFVTTSEDLADPMSPELEHSYRQQQAKFAYLGPMLDRPGAVRAGTHSSASTEGSAAKSSAAHSANDVITLLEAAQAAGRQVVLVSMGTVVTGDDHWNARPLGPNGSQGLTGHELCHAAWSGVFDALGTASVDEGALIIVSLGPQADAMDGLTVPRNAVCMPSVPQVDVLRCGIDLFLTHGGQNSFTEAISTSTPVVVCPGFGDQAVNAGKAVSLGVGQKVDRPNPEVGQEAEAATEFRAEVCRMMKEVIAEPSYKAAAKCCAERLQHAGGTERAVQLFFEAVSKATPQKVADAQPANRRSQAMIAGA